MFAEARMAEMCSMGIGNKPCLAIRPSADQIQERSVEGGRTRPRRPHSVCSSSSSSAGSNYGSAGDSTLRSNTLNSRSSLGQFSTLSQRTQKTSTFFFFKFILC